jgi:hypothetical protein
MTTDIAPRIGSTWKHIKLATAVTSVCMELASDSFQRLDTSSTAQSAASLKAAVKGARSATRSHDRAWGHHPRERCQLD